MSRVSFTEKDTPFSLDIDEADEKLLTEGGCYEEDISSPVPYGPDFLDVQVGELFPPEADSDWGVVRLDHKDDARVQVLRKLGFGGDASVWLAQVYPQNSVRVLCALFETELNSCAEPRSQILRRQGVLGGSHWACRSKRNQCRLQDHGSCRHEGSR